MNKSTKTDRSPKDIFSESTSSKETSEAASVEVSISSEAKKGTKAGSRIIVPTRNKKSLIESSSIIPAVDLLLHDAKAIVAAELAQYRNKTSRGISLDLKEARVVQGYLETLIKLQKEERDQARAEDLSNLSDEELMELATKVLGSTQPKLIEDK